MTIYISNLILANNLFAPGAVIIGVTKMVCPAMRHPHRYIVFITDERQIHQLSLTTISSADTYGRDSTTSVSIHQTGLRRR